MSRARKKISQRAAVRAIRRLKELDRYTNDLLSKWPNGTVLHTFGVHDNTRATVRAAHNLGFAVLVTITDDGNAKLTATRPKPAQP